MVKRALKALVLLFSLFVVASLCVASLSLGINNVTARTKSLSGIPLSGFVGLNVTDIDARRTLGPLVAGLSTPLFMLTLSEDTGVDTHFIFPGIGWYGYIGARLSIGRVFFQVDIGRAIALGQDLELGFTPVRLGIGLMLNKHTDIETSAVGILEQLEETLGRILAVQLGYVF